MVRFGCLFFPFVLFHLVFSEVRTAPPTPNFEMKISKIHLVNNLLDFLKLHFPKSKALDSKWEDVGAYPSSFPLPDGNFSTVEGDVSFFLGSAVSVSETKEKPEAWGQCCLNTAMYLGTDLRIGAEISCKWPEPLT